MCGLWAPVSAAQALRDLQCALWGIGSPVGASGDDLPLNLPWPPSHPPVCSHLTPEIPALLLANYHYNRGTLYHARHL